MSLKIRLGLAVPFAAVITLIFFYSITIMIKVYQEKTYPRSEIFIAASHISKEDDKVIVPYLQYCEPRHGDICNHIVPTLKVSKIFAFKTQYPVMNEDNQINRPDDMFFENEKQNEKQNEKLGCVPIDSSIILRIAPIYPLQAFEQGLEGQCVVKFDINACSRASNVTAICSSPIFEEAAIYNTKRYSYSEANKKGETRHLVFKLVE